MGNPAKTREYWRGYRAAKLAVYLEGIESADRYSHDLQKSSTYAKGYFASLERIKNEIVEALHRDDED